MKTPVKFNLGALIALALIFAGAPLAGHSPAYAASCKERAAQVAAQTGGKLLSVSTVGSKCRISILISNGNGPPKSKVVVVAK